MKRVARLLAFPTVLIAVAASGLTPLPAEAPAVYPRAADEPEAWCPTGTALDAFLEARRALPVGSSRELAPSPPLVTPMDGFLLIEDDGVILQDDRVFDLPMQTIELLPSGGGYQVSIIPLAYEPVTGPALFADQSSWRSQPVTLSGFAFPFGGENRTQLWVTSTNLVAFEPPTEPVKVGLCSVGCYFDEGQVLLDRLPRISPLQHGSFLYGWNAWVHEESDRVVITWQYANAQNLDVQAVLFADGRIRLNYAAVSGIEHGAAVVVTGNETFWNDLRLGGDATDPQGDVPIAAPDGPAMDLLGASARQVGTSELLQVQFTLDAPPPVVSEEERIFYQIDLRNDASDPEPLGSILFQWQRGVFYWMSEPASLDGTTLTLNLRLGELAPAGNQLHITFRTFRGDTPYEEGDSIELLAFFVPPTETLMLDLDADLPHSVGVEPFYEAFTLPALQVGEVLEVVEPLFEDPAEVEAFAIFQNLQTDIFFFAGAYHAGGNSGADGIGFGSSASPRLPSLLHLNNIYNYGFEDQAMQVLNHELGHRWLYHFAIDEGGNPSRILNPVGSHPAGWVHTPAVRPVYRPLDYSVMGGSNWAVNGDGTFSSPIQLDGWGSGFSWHELYLIGLADEAEVPDWWYIADANPPLPSAYWAPNDTTVSGQSVPVSLSQVVAVEGPRFPAYPDALQSFLTPIVLVTRPGAFQQSEIDTLDSVCTIWQPNFHLATNNRGSLRCRFAPPLVDITTPPADVQLLAGDGLEFIGQGSDDDGDNVELRWSFVGVAPDTTGAGPHSLTFTSTGVYPIRLDGVDDTGMLASNADTVQVTVECPGTAPTDAVEGLALRREAGQLRFTWTDQLAPPADYVVLRGDTPQGPFYPRGAAVSGAAGLLLPEPAGDAYYKIAARDADGCLGPY